MTKSFRCHCERIEFVARTLWRQGDASINLGQAIMTSSLEQSADGQATYGMSNLRPERTGLPFIVFISQRDDARHAAGVKVSPAPRVKIDAMGSYSVEPFQYRAGIRLGSIEEHDLERWITANRRVLLDYWDGAIEYTEDALALLAPI